MNKQQLAAKIWESANKMRFLCFSGNNCEAQNERKTGSTDSNIFAFLQRNIHECKRHNNKNKNPRYYF